MKKYYNLEDVCEILDSKRVPITSTERVSGEYPYYGANGLQDYVNDYIFDDELVLLAEDGGNFGSKDKPIAYRVSGKCWVNNHAHVLKAKNDINVDYLCYSLMFYDTTGIVNGATRQKLTQASMRKMKIPLVSMSEQLKIVKKLDTITHILNKSKQKIVTLDNLVKSQFIEMFGDVNTNPKQWAMVKLQDVCSSIVRGPFGSALKKDFFVEKDDTTYKVYEQKNAIQKSDKLGTYHITKEKYEELKRFECKPHDFIMSCSGTMGELYQLPETSERGIINQALCKFTLNKKINPIVFLEFMKDAIRNIETKGSGIQNIASVVYIKNLDVYLPPIELQNQFADFVKHIDKLKFRKNITKLRNICYNIFSFEKFNMQREVKNG